MPLDLERIVPLSKPKEVRAGSALSWLHSAQQCPWQPVAVELWGCCVLCRCAVPTVQPYQPDKNPVCPAGMTALHLLPSPPTRQVWYFDLGAPPERRDVKTVDVEFTRWADFYLFWLFLLDFYSIALAHEMRRRDLEGQAPEAASQLRGPPPHPTPPTTGAARRSALQARPLERRDVLVQAAPIWRRVPVHWSRGGGRR